MWSAIGREPDEAVPGGSNRWRGSQGVGVLWRALATLYCGAVISIASVIGAIGLFALAGIGWPTSVHTLQGTVILAGLPCFFGVAIAALRQGWWRQRWRVRLPIDRRMRFVIGGVWMLSFATIVIAIASGHSGKSSVCGSHFCNYVFSGGSDSVVVISPRAYLIDQAGGLIFLSAWSAAFGLTAIGLVRSERPRPRATAQGTSAAR